MLCHNILHIEIKQLETVKRVYLNNWEKLNIFGNTNKNVGNCSHNVQRGKMDIQHIEGGSVFPSLTP